MGTAINRWRTECQNTGGRAVRQPDGVFRGALACRLPDHRLVLAPLSAQFEDRQAEAAIKRAQAAGVVASVALPVATAARDTSRAITQAPRAVVSDVTGIPPNVVTLVVLAGVVYAGYRLIQART